MGWRPVVSRLFAARVTTKTPQSVIPCFTCMTARTFLSLSMPGMFGCWYADTNAKNLIRFGKMRETIIVGVDNSADRFCEICSAQAAPTAPTARRHRSETSTSHWIADKFRPYINHTYRITAGRTSTDADNTGALGSSLGGLISAYMAWDWSSVFGKIGCFSSSFQVCMPFPRAHPPRSGPFECTSMRHIRRWIGQYDDGARPLGQPRIRL